MTTRELRALLEWWQPALRLADWDIEVKAVPRSRLGGDDGHCYAYPDLKEAEILVVSGRPSSKFADHETILVHELMHCHAEPLRTARTEDKVERLVEDVSKCIVRIARGEAP